MFWFQEGLERLLHLLGNMEMPLGAYYTNTLPTAGLTPARADMSVLSILCAKVGRKKLLFFCGGHKRLHGWLDVFGIFKRKQG